MKDKSAGNFLSTMRMEVPGPQCGVPGGRCPDPSTFAIGSELRLCDACFAAIAEQYPASFERYWRHKVVLLKPSRTASGTA
jgi:hypothetical protein